MTVETWTLSWRKHTLLSSVLCMATNGRYEIEVFKCETETRRKVTAAAASLVLSPQPLSSLHHSLHRHTSYASNILVPSAFVIPSQARLFMNRRVDHFNIGLNKTQSLT